MQIINISIETLLEIILFVSSVIGVYFNLNNKSIRQDERLKNVEKHFNWLSEEHKGFKMKVSEDNEKLSKALHDNSIILAELKTTLDHIFKQNKE